MGREVRRVPPDWQHPKDEDTGRYIPLHAPRPLTELRDEYVAWFANWEQWQRGEHPEQRDYAATGTFTDWDGGPPNPDDYMPPWEETERTHYQMYENTSEGTPISPVFATPEELARWLADTGASSFGSMTATYEQWLRVCRGGYAPSLVTDANGLRSGVEGAKAPPVEPTS